jgi:hypothetical protein
MIFEHRDSDEWKYELSRHASVLACIRSVFLLVRYESKLQYLLLRCACFFALDSGVHMLMRYCCLLLPLASDVAGSKPLGTIWGPVGAQPYEASATEEPPGQSKARAAQTSLRFHLQG